MRRFKHLILLVSLLSASVLAGNDPNTIRIALPPVVVCHIADADLPTHLLNGLSRGQLAFDLP